MERWMVRTVTVAAAVASAVALAGCSKSGKDVKFGETANAKGMDVTVLRIEQGSNADLNVLKDASKYAGKTPYYLRYRVKKTQDGKVDGPYFVVSAGDRELTGLTIMQGVPNLTPTRGPDGEVKLGTSDAPEFDKCKSSDDSVDFNKAPAGKSYEDCSIFIADQGVGAPSKVEWIKKLIGKDEPPLATWK